MYLFIYLGNLIVLIAVGVLHVWCIPQQNLQRQFWASVCACARSGFENGAVTPWRVFRVMVFRSVVPFSKIFCDALGMGLEQ